MERGYEVEDKLSMTGEFTLVMLSLWSGRSMVGRVDVVWLAVFYLGGEASMYDGSWGVDVCFGSI